MKANRLLFLSLALLGGTSLAIIGVSNGFSINIQPASLKGDVGEVSHTLTFGYGNVTEFATSDNLTWTSSLETTTAAGNTFTISGITLTGDSSHVPEKGNGQPPKDFIYLIENPSNPTGYSDSPFISFSFEMNVDVEGGVSSVVINKTVTLNNGHTGSESSSSASATLNTTDNLKYTVSYSDSFSSGEVQSVAIDSIVINYKCTY